MTEDATSNPGAQQPTPSTEALLEQGAQQLARSRRLLSEIDAMVRPEADWPAPERRDAGRSTDEH